MSLQLRRDQSLGTNGSLSTIVYVSPREVRYGLQELEGWVFWREVRERGKERWKKDKSTGQAEREGGQLGSPVHHQIKILQPIPLLGIHTEKTRVERDTCTPVFIAALFTIARTWKQPRCPSADEWIRRLWYMYTLEYYSAIKKNAFESVLMRWMKLEHIIQSEVSQKGKH